MQAKTPETVVLSVGEISGALRRVYGKQGVPADLDQLLRHVSLLSLAHDRSAYTLQGCQPQFHDFRTTCFSLHASPPVCPIRRELVHDGLGFLEARGSGPQGEQYLLNITSLLKLTRFHSLMAVIRCAWRAKVAG